MGWSIQVHKKEFENIFLRKKGEWSVQYIESSSPKVVVEYEGEIPVSLKKEILTLFPDFVYVDFHPNTLFSVGTHRGIWGVN